MLKTKWLSDFVGTLYKFSTSVYLQNYQVKISSDLVIDALVDVPQHHLNIVSLFISVYM